MSESADGFRSPDQRRKVLRVSGALFVDLFKAGRRCYEVVDGALPDDAEVVGARFDSLRDEWEIAIQSASFEPTSYAESLPELRPIVESFHRRKPA